MDSLTQALLEDIIRRESRSLLQYVRDAFPWVSFEERAALAQIEGMIDEEIWGAAQLARYLQKHHLPPPYSGPYPMEFANINYLALEHLIPLLIANQQRAIAAHERDAAALLDPQARTLAHTIIEKNRQHLQTLEKMTPREREAVKV